jgi:hypothetical protein
VFGTLSTLQFVMALGLFTMLEKAISMDGENAIYLGNPPTSG